MANIKISDLHSTGSELFIDSESYLNELTDENIAEINGGWFWVAVSASAAVYGVLPDAQKEWVNRRFQDVWRYVFQPIPVY